MPSTRERIPSVGVRDSMASVRLPRGNLNRSNMPYADQVSLNRSNRLGSNDSHRMGAGARSNKRDSLTNLAVRSMARGNFDSTIMMMRKFDLRQPNESFETPLVARSPQPKKKLASVAAANRTFSIDQQMVQSPAQQRQTEAKTKNTPNVRRTNSGAVSLGHVIAEQLRAR